VRERAVGVDRERGVVLVEDVDEVLRAATLSADGRAVREELVVPPGKEKSAIYSGF
jgi:hypothetical protein